MREQHREGGDSEGVREQHKEGGDSEGVGSSVVLVN